MSADKTLLWISSLALNKDWVDLGECIVTSVIKQLDYFAFPKPTQPRFINPYSSTFFLNPLLRSRFSLSTSVWKLIPTKWAWLRFYSIGCRDCLVECFDSLARIYPISNSDINPDNAEVVSEHCVTIFRSKKLIGITSYSEPFCAYTGLQFTIGSQLSME